MGSASAFAAAGLLGLAFGFQGSVSPGPLQTIIISETLSNGVKSSWRAAIIPPLTDPFALAVALFVVANVPNVMLAAIAFFGAGLLLRFAYLQFKTTEDDFAFQRKERASFWTIWATNFLNPNLWIFSFSINAFQINEFYRDSGFGVAATYLLTFFASISFFNLATAFLVAGLRRAFNAKQLVRINRVLGAFLLFVAARFLYLGLAKLGAFSSEPLDAAISALGALATS